jgi:hypothetical protein
MWPVPPVCLGPNPPGGGPSTPPGERRGPFRVSADHWNSPSRLSARNASGFRAPDFGVPLGAAPRAPAQRLVGTRVVCQASETARETALLSLPRQRVTGPLRVAKAPRNSPRAPSACYCKRKEAAGFVVPVAQGSQQASSYRVDHPWDIYKSCNLPNLLWNSELHFRQKAYWHDTITPLCPPIASLAAAFWRIRSS